MSFICITRSASCYVRSPAVYTPEAPNVSTFLLDVSNKKIMTGYGEIMVIQSVSNILPSISCFSSVHSLDSFGGLCDVSLFYQLWMSGTFLLLTWYLTVLLFRVYVTEVHDSELTPYVCIFTDCRARVVFYREAEHIYLFLH